jgi:hypothetical protein
MIEEKGGWMLGAGYWILDIRYPVSTINNQPSTI